MQHAHKIDLENAKPQIHSRNSLGGSSAWIWAPKSYYHIVQVRKWTDFKMHCTIQLQPWQLCAGDSRTVETWQGWSKGSWAGMEQNWYPVLVAVTLRKMSLFLSPWNPRWWGCFLVWLLLSDLSVAEDCTWLSVLTAACFWIVEGFPSGASCSRENACFPSAFA